MNLNEIKSPYYKFARNCRTCHKVFFTDFKKSNICLECSNEKRRLSRAKKLEPKSEDKKNFINGFRI